MRVKEIKNQSEWEGFAARQKFTSALQSSYWQQFQERNAQAFFVLEDKEVLLAALVVETYLPAGKSFLYSPRGPVFADNLPEEKMSEGLRMLASHLRQSFPMALFWRIDPAVPKELFNFHQAGLVKAFKEVQPKQTVILNLEKNEEELLAGMKSKTRYNIRLAEKRGVKVYLAKDQADFEKFYRILENTGNRGGFRIHGKKHYEKMWRLPIMKLYLADWEDKVIAGIMVSRYADTAVYLHGASDNEYRNVMAPYLLQWQAIREAKQNAMKFYDFWGVAPKEAGESHPWSGITKFKDGFGATYVEYPGAYDFVFSPVLYRLLVWVRTLRNRLAP